MTLAMLEVMPVAAYISQGWLKNKTAGVNPDPNGSTVEQLVAAYGNYQPHGHDGIDFGCAMRTPVVAPSGGVVDFAGWFEDMPQWVCDKYGYLFDDDSGGIAVLIDHGNGLASALLHLDQTDMNAGARVHAGQLVGLSGTTGRSGGPHLHWSLILLSAVYTTVLYGRIDPLARIPAGLSIPLGPGGTGGVTKQPTLVGLPGIPIPHN